MKKVVESHANGNVPVFNNSSLILSLFSLSRLKFQMIKRRPDLFERFKFISFSVFIKILESIDIA